jgi:membrane fusion protein, multidrug efflux system
MKRLVYILLALLLVAAGFIWNNLNDMPLVETATLTTGPAIEAVYATGTVEPTIMLPIAARKTARLVALMVDEGAAVATGDVLAQLDDSDMQAVLDELEARRELARQSFNRQNSIRNSAAFNRAALDAAEAELRGAEAAIAKAMSDIEDLKLIAPDEGRIIRRDGEIGEMIPSGQAVFWFTCCAPLRISAEVDEEDIPMVTPDQKVLIRADAFPGQIFDGHVQAITPKGDPTARSYRVRIGLNGETPLMIGMTAETNIILREAEHAILAPRSAVIGNHVWILDRNDTLRRVGVTTGTKSSTQIEILSGLKDGDEIIVNPEPDWYDGQAARRDWRLRNLTRAPIGDRFGS